MWGDSNVIFFIPYLCRLFSRHDVGQAVINVCYSDITFVVINGRLLKPTDSILFEQRDRSSPLSFTQYAVLPHNIDIVT